METLIAVLYFLQFALAVFIGFKYKSFKRAVISFLCFFLCLAAIFAVLQLLFEAGIENQFLFDISVPLGFVIGNVVSIGSFIRNDKRKHRYTDGEPDNPVSRLISPILLFILLLMAVGGTSSFFEDFFNVPSLIVVFGFSTCLGVMTHGKKDFFAALQAIRVLFTSSATIEECSRKNVIVLNNYITYVYSSGVIGTVMGIILFLMSDSFDPDVIPAAFSLSILTLFYSLIIAEFAVRPAVKRINYLIETDKVESKEQPTVEDEGVDRKPSKALVFLLSSIVVFLCILISLYMIKTVSQATMRRQLEEGLSAPIINIMTEEAESVHDQKPQQALTDEVNN